MKKIGFQISSFCLGLFWLTLLIRAEQLPAKNYTTAENLAHERVRVVRRDSRGFLWFGTGDGLSRFDGYEFTNYNAAQGLTQPAINDIIETRSNTGGAYWLATNGGAVLFEPDAAPGGEKSQFTLFEIGEGSAPPSSSQRVNCLFEDRNHRVWAGAARGLFYFDEREKRFRRADFANDFYVNHIAEDAAGDLWVATSGGLVRRSSPDNRVQIYEPGKSFNYLHFDADGRLWAGFDGGLLVVKTPEASQSGVLNFIEKPQTLVAGGRLELHATAVAGFLFTGVNKLSIVKILRTADERVWIVSRSGGAFELTDGNLRHYTAEQGLRDSTLNAAEIDIAGNVWLGTESSGAVKIARHGFTTFGAADGLGRFYVRRVFETNAGEIVAVGRTPAWWRFDAASGRFAPLKLNLPADAGNLREHGNEAPFQTRNGEWWVAAAKGLFRFPAVRNPEQLATAEPLAVYTEKNGLPNPNLVTIWEDSRGDVWIGTRGEITISRWERTTGKFYGYTAEADGAPTSEEPPLAFAEDHAGGVWIGFKGGGLARFAGGRFRLFNEADGVPAGTIATLFTDRAGRLWIPTYRGGVMRIDDPTEEKFKFQIYAPASGLSSVNVRCVAEDAQGRFYIGTVRGVDRLTPETGEIRHFTVADGLAYSESGNCFLDSRGALWFASYRGLSKFVPETANATPAAPTLISGLRVAGVAYPVSGLGQTEIVLPEFNYRQNNLQIDFFSISFASADQIRYQYRLGGARATGGDWSEPTAERTVNFANLAPGDYEFAARVVNADNSTSRNPAIVKFKILPPVWQQWWFIALCCLAAGGVLLWFERYRAARLKEKRSAMENLEKIRAEKARELEQVRRRIAADLHDDIGTSLTQISILSEVLRQQQEQQLNGNGNGKRDASATNTLDSIAASSRELVDAMSDIVWAINPQKDHLSDLTGKMRRFAADSFTPRRIKFTFAAPDLTDDLPLGANLRREVFLIFKEAINNVVKHAAARAVEIDFKIERDEIRLTVRDDGCGFAVENSIGGGGHGLASMTERAKSLGGELKINSLDGGTTIEIGVPLGSPAAPSETAA